MYFIGIEAFLAIVESGSVSKAADILHVSQSTVSYRLKNLEDELGFKVLERNQGIQGINLTSQGYKYLNIAEKLMELQKETETIKEAFHREQIIFGVADSISQYILPEFYKEFVKKFPNLRPFIMTQHTMETYESIKLKEIDLGFVKREYSMPNVFVKKVLEDEMVLVRYGDLNDYSECIDPRDLKEEDEIFMDWGYTYQVWHDNWWRPNGYLLRVDSASLIFKFLEKKEQWAIVPISVFNEFSGSGNFIGQKISSPPPNRTCYMIRNKYVDKSLESVFDFIEHYFSNY